MNEIKFKQGGSEAEFYKIDLATGAKISFLSTAKPKTSGFGMNKEMQAWVEDGNEIEEQTTPEEQAQKESEDLALAEKQIIDDAKTWLSDNDWKYMQHQRRVARETITPAQETEFRTFLDDADQKAQIVK